MRHVVYNGTEYVCLQAHTSQTGWEPGTIGGASLWSAVS